MIDDIDDVASLVEELRAPSRRKGSRRAGHPVCQLGLALRALADRDPKLARAIIEPRVRELINSGPFGGRKHLKNLIWHAPSPVDWDALQEMIENWDTWGARLLASQYWADGKLGPGRPPERGETATARLPATRVHPSELAHWRAGAAERSETLSEGIRAALADRYGLPPVGNDDD